MTPITNLVQQHGSQAALARHFKVAPNQVHRWLQAGALVDKYGNVWIISRKAKQSAALLVGVVNHHLSVNMG